VATLNKYFVFVFEANNLKQKHGIKFISGFLHLTIEKNS